MIRNMRGTIFAVNAGASGVPRVNSRIRQLATPASGAVSAGSNPAGGTGFGSRKPISPWLPAPWATGNCVLLPRAGIEPARRRNIEAEPAPGPFVEEAARRSSRVREGRPCGQRLGELPSWPLRQDHDTAAGSGCGSRCPGTAAAALARRSSRRGSGGCLTTSRQLAPAMVIAPFWSFWWD
jgi:hypothetical protein